LRHCSPLHLRLLLQSMHCFPAVLHISAPHPFRTCGRCGLIDNAIIPSIIKSIGTSCLFIVAVQSTLLFIYCRRAIDTPVCLLSPRLIDTWFFIYCRRFIDLTVCFLSPFYQHHCVGCKTTQRRYSLNYNHLEDHRDAHDRTPPLDTLRVIANCKLVL